jgi:hypothetical protein
MPGLDYSRARILDTYLGIEPFTVLVDDCKQLRDLATIARTFRPLSFEDKLSKVTDLTLDGLADNAYEQMVLGSTPERRALGKRLVFEKHPLSTALQERSGCCRYQGALFFVLGYEAQLGDSQLIQTAPVNSRANTVFNHVVDGDTWHIISIFTKSLKNKELDYTVDNPRLFEEVEHHVPGYDMYSYHRDGDSWRIAVNPAFHVLDLGDVPR